MDSHELPAREVPSSASSRVLKDWDQHHILAQCCADLTSFLCFLYPRALPCVRIGPTATLVSSYQQTHACISFIR